MSLMASLFRKATNKIDHVSSVCQVKPGEDGLACVAIILKAHNFKESMEGLQKKYPQFSCGMSLKAIVDIFHQYGFITRPLHCPIDEVQNLKFPCILHWDMNQFVVLNRVDGGIFTVLNPVDKKSRYKKDEFEQHYSDVALEICFATTL
ncbi:cysteine peptidase family C39 domain-containing protein [Cellvibrio sp.]|uniref:cysteine peptidase family C39 domain-containing protein n=1 Tax=Cellvibrio sp. TaxID=1965322 RepID=UPI00396480DB